MTDFANISLDRQFAGQARLVRLLLWRVGDSTDVDLCIARAIEQGMIQEDDAQFLRKCMAHEEATRDGVNNANMADGANGANDVTGGEPFEIDNDTILRLRRCADKLNRADSA